MSKTVEERFWEKVDTSGECWEWQGHRDRRGYGKFKYSKNATGAHRVAWELTNGPIPAGKVIMHLCDNCSCVNPAHLQVGSQAENVADAVRKGRHQRGDRNGKAKLTEADVIAIREEYEPYKVSCATLATKYGVAEEQVRNIIHRVNWGHVK